MTEHTDPAAAALRLQTLEEAQRVYDLCDCSYPIVIYRNGHGHSPGCQIAIEFQRKLGIR